MGKYANSESPSDFGSVCAAQVDDKFGALTFANNAISFVGACNPKDFELPDNSFAPIAALTIATGCMNFFKGPVASGIPGAPANGGVSVVSGTIIVAAILPLITGLLTSYFATGDNKKDSFESELDGILDKAIKVITTLHIEMVVVGTATVPILFPGVAS